MSNIYETPAKDDGVMRTESRYTTPSGDELPVTVDYTAEEDGEIELYAIWYGALDLCQFLKDADKASFAWKLEREMAKESRAMRAEMRAQIHADAWGA